MTNIKRIQQIQKHIVASPTIFALFVKVLGAGIAFLTTVLIGRSLGAADMGIYFLCFSLVAMTSVACRLGLDNVFLRHIADSDKSVDPTSENSQIYFTGLLFVLFFSSAGSAFLFAMSDVIAVEFLDKPALITPLRIMAFSVVPLGVLTVNSMCLRGKRRYLTSIVCQDLSIPFFSLIFGLFLLKQFGIVGAAIMYLLSSVISCLVSIFWWIPYLTSIRFSYEAVESLWDGGRHLYLASIINRALIPWIPVFLLGYLSTADEVGYYSAANRVAMIVAMVFVTISGIVAPQFASAYKNEQFARLQRLSKKSAVTSSMIVVPLGVVLIVSDEAILGVFGDGFKDAGGVLAVLVLGRVFASLFGAQGHLLMMVGREKEFKYATLYSAMMLVALLFMFVKKFGAVGAAYAVSFSLVLSACAYAYYAIKNLKLKCYFFGIVPIS